jgi:hypothetical protein
MTFQENVDVVARFVCGDEEIRLAWICGEGLGYSPQLELNLSLDRGLKA